MSRSWQAPPAAVNAIVAKAKAASEDPQVQDNHLFHLLFNREKGLYCDVPGKRRLRRRQWIERYVRIRDGQGKIVPLVANHAQRQLEATTIRMERAGVPVRIQILKARKEGISTYLGGMSLEIGLRSEYFRSLIVAHKQDSAKILLGMVNIARQKMPKNATGAWDFRMSAKAKRGLEWDTPIHCEMTITSAEGDNPARGGTPSFIHLSESAYYPKADETAASILSSLPTATNTYGFDESTANGASGKFHDDFWSAWKQRDVPFAQRRAPWHALFFPWWQHADYRYTRSYGAGRPVPEDVYREIINSRSGEEDWLLRQKYIRRWRPEDEWEQVIVNESEELKLGRGGKILGYWRNQEKGRVKWRRKGVGWQKVDVDQLVWRRMKMADKDFTGGEDPTGKFNQEYPSRPEVAFASSGSPVFDQIEISRRLDEARTIKPVFRGLLFAPGTSMVTTLQEIEEPHDAGTGTEATA